MTSRSPFDEAEGAGAHGLSVELGRVEVDALEQVLGDDAGPRVHEHGEKGSVRIAQTKAHRVIVEHLDRLLGEVLRPFGIVLVGELGEADEGIEVRAMRRRYLGVEDSVKGESDVARSEGLAVVPPDALLELERVGQTVARDFPRFCEEGPDVQVLVQLEQAVEHRPLGNVRLPVGRHERVERRRIAEKADDHLLARRARGTGRREAEEHDEEAPEDTLVSH